MAAIAPSLTDGYLESEIATAGLKIQFNPDVIYRLNAAVMEGFKLVPRRGLEVGGLLLGRVDAGTVVVDDFAPVASEHQHGPSWLLSEKDKEQLADALSKANDPDKPTRVVGMYRSQTRAGFAPSEEDIAVFKEHGGSIFLLVKPEGIGRSSALFAAGDDLKNVSEVFPFRGKLGGATPSRSETPRAAGTSAAASQPITRDSDRNSRGVERLARLRTDRVLEGLAADTERMPAKTPGAGRVFAQIAWTVAILFCAAIGGYMLAKWWTGTPEAEPAPPASPASLALHATWTGSNLRIEWDRNAAPIRRASGGVLWIDDGAQHRRLDLALDDLTQGSIQYWPTSSDVSFRLAVITPEATASESVRAVSVPVVPRSPVAQPETPVRGPTPASAAAGKSAASAKTGRRAAVEARRRSSGSRPSGR